jgi:Tol biopolymer transport system component
MRITACGLALTASLVASADSASGTAMNDVADSSKIVFSAGPELFGERADLFTVNPDGTRLARITGGPGRDFDPAWSPDHRQIAFVRRLKVGVIDDHLMVMGADGQSRRDLGVKGYSPSWSPDGSRIAFTAVSGRSAAVWTVNSDGSSPRRLGLGQEPSWSPDGRQIAVARLVNDGHAIFVMNSDGSGVRRLVSQKQLNARAPSWSPDGRQIAFVGGAGIVYVIARTGGQPRRVIKSGTNGGEPEWSADSSRIQFNGDHALFVSRRDGSAMKRLAVGQVEDSCWSPGGETIAFGWRPDVFSPNYSTASSRINTVKAGGSRVRRITQGFAYVGEMDW